MGRDLLSRAVVLKHYPISPQQKVDTFIFAIVTQKQNRWLLYSLSVIKQLQAKFLSDGGPWEQIRCRGLICVSLEFFDMQKIGNQCCRVAVQ